MSNFELDVQKLTHKTKSLELRFIRLHIALHARPTPPPFQNMQHLPLTVKSRGIIKALDMPVLTMITRFIYVLANSQAFIH